MSTKTTGSTMNWIGLLSGILFGAVLAGARLHEYDTIHNTLALEDPYVFLFMGSAIFVSAPLLWWLERRGTITPLGGELALSKAKPEPHHIKGGALFGIGWAIAGTCPAPALVMVSSGAMLGLIAIPGIFLGLWLREQQAIRELEREINQPTHATPPARQPTQSS